MSDVTIYETSTGKILRTLDVPEPMIELQVQSGESYYLGRYLSDTHYFLTDVPTVRPTQSTSLSAASLPADGSTTITISSAPVGATCTITEIKGPHTTGAIHSITGTIDGTDTFRTTLVGDMTIAVELFPYLTWQGAINAF